MLLSLTERGHEVVGEIVARHVERERELLSALSQREQDQLAGLLRKLLIGLDDVPPEAASRPVRSTEFSPQGTGLTKGLVAPSQQSSQVTHWTEASPLVGGGGCGRRPPG